MARILCNYLRSHIGNVGVGFDRQSLPREVAKNRYDDDYEPDDLAAIQTESDETIDHWRSAPSRAKTISPAFTPLFRIVRSPCCSPGTTGRCSNVFGATWTKTVVRSPDMTRAVVGTVSSCVSQVLRITLANIAGLRRPSLLA